MKPILADALAVLSLSFGALSFAAAPSQEDRFANVKVEAQHVAGAVHMLTGQGGNIGASIGVDGTLVIDDQFAPLAERIGAALAALGGARPRFVLNTHFHGDHTGSNAYFGKSATIIAQDNVRVRLLAQPDIARAALPLVTFSDRVRVHFNDDDVDVMHLPRGHTDGDAVVWFKKANVVHMGDQFFNGSFPYIDLASGGSVEGYVANLATVLGWVPKDAHVIPGHGKLATVADLQSFHDMIAATAAIVRTAAGAGQSLDDIIEAGLGAQYAPFGTGFINEGNWIRTVHASYFGAPTPKP